MMVRGADLGLFSQLPPLLCCAGQEVDIDCVVDHGRLLWASEWLGKNWYRSAHLA